jgi:hypothetical protein
MDRQDFKAWVKVIAAGSEMILRCIKVSDTGMTLLASVELERDVDVELEIRLGGMIHKTHAKVCASGLDSLDIEFINAPSTLVQDIQERFTK